MAAKRVQAPDQHVPSRKPTRNPEPLPEAPRAYAPRGIAALLAPILRPAFRKRAPGAAQILADWAMLAGPDLAAQASPIRFSAGTLTLACTGPVAMQLQLAAPIVMQRLNLALGAPTVQQLRFVQQAPTLTTPLPLPARVPPKPPPENLPEGPLGEALARLYQGVQSKTER